MAADETIQKLQKEFGDDYRVLSMKDFGEEAIKKMKKENVTPDNSLVVTCLCRDDILHRDNPFTDYFRKGRHGFFKLGGLMGFPAGGIKAMMAASHHVPEGKERNIVVIYGPHIGITKSGELGKVMRRGHSHESSDCGAMVGFLSAYKAANLYKVSQDPLNREIAYVESRLLPHMKETMRSENPLVHLTKKAFKLIDEDMVRILKEAEHEMHGAQVKAIRAIFVNGPENKDYVCIKKKQGF